MSTEAKTPETQTVTPAAPVTIETASFADYERLRRGEKIEAPAASDQSAPVAEKATEQKPSEKSDSSETDDKESEAKDDTQEEGETEAESKDEEEKPAAKKKGGFQRRIDKLNGRNAALQQRLEVLESLLAKNAGGAKTDAPTVDKESKDDSGEGPQPDQYETHQAWVEARIEWKADQKFMERDQKAEQAQREAEQRKAVGTWVERQKAFAEKAADYDDVIAEVDDIPLSPAVREILLTSENGPELAYELAKNRDEYARVCKLPAIAAAREMGKIESRLAAKASEEKKPEPKKTTQAPKPIDPVGGSKSAGAHKTLEDMSFAEYEKARREQMKRRRA